MSQPGGDDLKAGDLVTAETTQAITKGLVWLAAHQQKDGSFGSGAYEGSIANTSIAGLALMSAGSEPGRGLYGEQLEKALTYVMDSVRPSGYIFREKGALHGPMYHHAFAVLFLAEAYQLSKRPEIREKLERAVRLIVDTQNNEGGWRYQPVRNDADLSVTICQLNALRAVRQAGVHVPRETLERCGQYIKQSQNLDGGFRYMLPGGASAYPRSAGGTLGLATLLQPDPHALDQAVAYLLQFKQAAKLGQRYSHYFYGQYYAAQAMHIQGGDLWTEWYPAIRAEILSKQTREGCWMDSIGNDYGTAMALIILQMPKSRLPLFQRPANR
jgi:hypothetical protein